MKKMKRMGKQFCVFKLTSYPNGHLVPVTDDCYFLNIPTKMTEINIIELK